MGLSNRARPLRNRGLGPDDRSIDPEAALHLARIVDRAERRADLLLDNLARPLRAAITIAARSLAGCRGSSCPGSLEDWWRSAPLLARNQPPPVCPHGTLRRSKSEYTCCARATDCLRA